MGGERKRHRHGLPRISATSAIAREAKVALPMSGAGCCRGHRLDGPRASVRAYGEHFSGRHVKAHGPRDRAGEPRLPQQRYTCCTRNRGGYRDELRTAVVALPSASSGRHASPHEVGSVKRYHTSDGQPTTRGIMSFWSAAHGGRLPCRAMADDERGCLTWKS